MMGKRTLNDDNNNFKRSSALMKPLGVQSLISPSVGNSGMYVWVDGWTDGRTPTQSMSIIKISSLGSRLL